MKYQKYVYINQLIGLPGAWLLLFFLGGCFGQLDVEIEDPNAILADDFYDGPEAYRQALAGAPGGPNRLLWTYPSETLGFPW